MLESDLDNAMKRSSRVLEIFRELPDGARQWSTEFELALELPAENFTSRMGRSLTVIAGGYKIFISVSVTRAYYKYEIEWYRVTYVSIWLGDVSFFYAMFT